MDRHHPSQRPPERPYDRVGGPPPPSQSGPPPLPSNYGSPFHPQTAQPPVQIPFSDPFHTKRDPFLPDRRDRSGSFSLSNGQTNGGRPWPGAAQGPPGAPAPNNNDHAPPPPPPPPPPQMQHHHQQHPRPPQQLPPPPPNAANHHMQAQYDPSHRGSLSGQGSPSQFPRAPHESLPPPPSYPARHMPPPPSPPQMPPGSSQPPMMASASRDQRQPNSSPFAHNIEPASSSAGQRPGMSISAMLGGGDDRRPVVNSSPHAPNAAPSPTPRSSMRPPSPARARSSSMREGYQRGFRPPSPGRASAFAEQRPASAALGQEREPRREGGFGSPQYQRGSAHSFRAFQGPPHPLFDNHRREFVNMGPQGRPSSQPSEPPTQRGRLEEIGVREREVPSESRLGMFRHYGELPGSAPYHEGLPKQEHGVYTNGAARASQPPEQTMFRSPQPGQESLHGRERMPGAPFGTPMREDQAGSFRPAYHHIPHSVPEQARTEYGPRNIDEMRREQYRSSPPRSDMHRPRNGVQERPMTFEEHQRSEAINRELQQRKESEGTVARAILGVSPELNRKGRSSPLPQAVQGAQPKHVGPGDTQPGVRGEFGRMFSGLGSGVGSTTPTAGRNGTATPSRLSPTKQVESGDLVRTAVDQIEEGRGGSRGGARGGKRNSRKMKEDDRDSLDGRGTPGASTRGNKRAKTGAHIHHHHHAPAHHHHHHHEGADVQPSPFSTIRFPSNPLANSNPQPSNPPPHHHHHRHAAGHAHPAASHVHHHHHVPRAPPPPRKPSVTVHNSRLLDSVAHLPRKNLGSQVYETVLAPAPTTTTPLDTKIKFSSKMKPIPVFQGQENSIYTVRVPREYLSTSSLISSAKVKTEDEPSALEEVCRRRQAWGTDIYTDDSDVIAAAVHSGWLRGDFGPEANADLHDLDLDEQAPQQQDFENGDAIINLSTKPPQPITPPRGYDAHISLLILPPLESYASSHQHHLWSREWKDTPHDGMSYAVLGVQFVKEGDGSRGVGRSGKDRKARLRLEEERRREAVEGLLMFKAAGANFAAPANGGRGGAVGVSA